jgi:hypothetical protein
MGLFIVLDYFRILHSEEGSCPKFVPIEDDLCTHLSALYIFFCIIPGFSLINYAISVPKRVVKDDIYATRDKTSERERYMLVYLNYKCRQVHVVSFLLTPETSFW